MPVPARKREIPSSRNRPGGSRHPGRLGGAPLRHLTYSREPGRSDSRWSGRGFHQPESGGSRLGRGRLQARQAAPGATSWGGPRPPPLLPPSRSFVNLGPRDEPAVGRYPAGATSERWDHHRRHSGRVSPHSVSPELRGVSRVQLRGGGLQRPPLRLRGSTASLVEWLPLGSCGQHLGDRLFHLRQAHARPVRGRGERTTQGSPV